jgi:hypothetical protein
MAMGTGGGMMPASSLPSVVHFGSGGEMARAPAFGGTISAFSGGGGAALSPQPFGGGGRGMMQSGGGMAAVPSPRGYGGAQPMTSPGFGGGGASHSPGTFSAQSAGAFHATAPMGGFGGGGMNP